MEKNLYDSVVTFYDRMAMAVLGEGYQKSKWIFLEEIMAGDCVLYIGGGSGENLSAVLQKVGSRGRVFYVEASQKMLDRAKKRMGLEGGANLFFLHQAEFSELPLLRFDFVITQYFLDVLSDPQINDLFEELGKRTRTKSKWLLVDFYNNAKRRGMQFLMITFFRFMTKHPRRDLPDYDHFFKEYRWQKQKEKGFKNGWIKAVVFKKD